MSYTPQWTGTDAAQKILAIAHRVAGEHPDFWNELKVPGQTSRKFINQVSFECLKAGIPVGVNLKRGGPQQSLDAIALPNDTGARDSTGTYKGVEIVDIVGGAETPSPSLTWGDVTQITIDTGNPGGWVAGKEQAPSVPVVPPFPPRDETLDAGLEFNAHYHAKGAAENGTLGGRFSEIRRFLDFEGEVVWFSEYLRRRQLGETHPDAVAHVKADIDKAWGS